MIEQPSLDQNGLQKNQFSLQILFYFMLVVGGGIGFALGMLPIGSSDGSLYFLPTEIFGDASIIFAGVAMSCFPIILLIIGYKLFRCRPVPVTICVFLLAFLLAVLQIVFARPWLPELMLRIATAILVILAFASVFEVVAKKLKCHCLTAGLACSLAFGYWFFTQFIVVAMRHV